MVLGLIGVVCGAAVLVAQAKINPTDPQPTCAMCPGYYIPASELQAYTKKAVAEKLTDQQVRDVEIGKAHVGIGMVHRSRHAWRREADAWRCLSRRADRVARPHYTAAGTATPSFSAHGASAGMIAG